MQYHISNTYASFSRIQDSQKYYQWSFLYLFQQVTNTISVSFVSIVKHKIFQDMHTLDIHLTMIVLDLPSSNLLVVMMLSLSMVLTADNSYMNYNKIFQLQDRGNYCKFGGLLSPRSEKFHTFFQPSLTIWLDLRLNNLCHFLPITKVRVESSFFAVGCSDFYLQHFTSPELKTLP